MDNECLNFSARFSGVERDIFLPMESILAIFARENSQGIFFEEIDSDGTDPDDQPAKSSLEPNHSQVKSKTKKAKRSSDHLKVIK